MGPDLTVDKLLQDRATVPQRRVVECAVDDYGYSPPLGAIFASAGLSAMYRVLHLEPRRAPPGQVAARRPLDTIPSRPIPQAYPHAAGVAKHRLALLARAAGGVSVTRRLFGKHGLIMNDSRQHLKP